MLVHLEVSPGPLGIRPMFFLSMFGPWEKLTLMMLVGQVTVPHGRLTTLPRLLTETERLFGISSRTRFLPGTLLPSQLQ